MTVFPADQKIKVAVVGDSNIAGYGVSNVSINANSPQLNYRLGGNYEVKNYGNSGKTALKNGSDPYIKTSQYKNSLSYNPDIVIIQLGSNDSRYYNYAKIDQFVTDYTDIVKSYKNLASKPIIYISLPPTVFSKNFDISQAEIVKMLPLFFEIAETEDIGMVDNHTATADISDLMSDSIHPNAKGTSRIANSMYRSLKGDYTIETPSKELNEYYEVYAGVNSTDNDEFQLKELGSGSWISYKDVDLSDSKGSIQLYASVRFANTKVTIRKGNKDGEILGEKILNTSGNISKFLYHEVEFTPTENIEDIYICVSRQGSAVNDEIMRLKSVDFYYDNTQPFDVSNNNQLIEALDSNISTIRFVEDIKLTKNIKLTEDTLFDLNSKMLDSGGYRFYTDNSATKKIRVDLKNGQLKGTTNVLFANSGNKSDANKGMNVFIENIMCAL